MSALVRYFLSKGDSVAGYDLTPSPLTHALSEEGATIHYEDDPELIRRPFRTRIPSSSSLQPFPVTTASWLSSAHRATV